MAQKMTMMMDMPKDGSKLCRCTAWAYNDSSPSGSYTDGRRIYSVWKESLASSMARKIIADQQMEIEQFKNRIIIDNLK